MIRMSTRNLKFFLFFYFNSENYYSFLSGQCRFLKKLRRLSQSAKFQIFLFFPPINLYAYNFNLHETLENLAFPEYSSKFMLDFDFSFCSRCLYYSWGKLNTLFILQINPTQTSILHTDHLKTGTKTLKSHQRFSFR